MSIVPTTDRLAFQVGRMIRHVRRSTRLTQAALGAAVGVSQSAISRIERGRMPGLSLRLLSDLCDVLAIAIEFQLRPPWLADPATISQPSRVDSTARQRDLVHARCSAYVRRRLENQGWLVLQEVRIGLRRSHGFIDILAFHPATGTLLVGEIKTELRDIGELQRVVAWYLDEALPIARLRAWEVAAVLGVVFLLDSAANDERMRSNREALGQAFPLRSRRLAPWLRDPSTFLGQARPFEGPQTPSMGLAMIAPLGRRREWLIPTGVDGRRSQPRYLDYRDAAARLSSADTRPQQTP